MSKTILICGYGSGISDAVARRFGTQGFSVALAARSVEKLNAAAQALSQSGIQVKAIPTDLGDAKAVKALVSEARSALGPIHTIHWNAYSFLAGDLTTATEDEFRGAIDISVTGLITATQSSLADLKEQKGAILVTGGGLAFYDPNLDAMATQWNAMGLAVAKAAQHKLTGVLAAKLKGDDIYVGEVIVMGAVKGTPFDRGNATIDASDVANKFWELSQSRTTLTVNFPG